MLPVLFYGLKVVWMQNPRPVSGTKSPVFLQDRSVEGTRPGRENAM